MQNQKYFISEKMRVSHFLAVVISAEKIPAELDLYQYDGKVGNPSQIMEDQLYWCGSDGKSMSSCVKFMQSKLELYTLKKWTCAVTETLPAYSWMQYEAYESKYELYAICGDGVQSNISGYDLVQACSMADSACNGNNECALNTITNWQYTGRYKFCRDRYNLLVHRNPGSAAWYGYNGAQSGNGGTFCTAYCTN